MADVRIKCPLCGNILSADDNYLRYTVGCGKCHGTFVFDSICIEGNQGTIPVFPLANENNQELNGEKRGRRDTIDRYDTLDDIKVGVLAKAVFGYAIKNHKCSKRELRELESAEKSKELFRFRYPLLLSFPSDRIDESALVFSGYCRYYKVPVIVDNVAYFICRQWWDFNRHTILLWAEKHKITTETIRFAIEEAENETFPLFDSNINIMPSDGRNKAAAELHKKNASFFKSLNKSIFVIGVTIPNDLRKSFLRKLSIKKLECGKSHPIKVVVDGNPFEAKVLKANQKNKCYFWRIQWHKSSPIAKYLQNRFPNAYRALSENSTSNISSQSGILVEATNEEDSYSITCIGEDIGGKKIDRIKAEHGFDKTAKTETDNQKIEIIDHFTLQTIPQVLSYTKPHSISFLGNVFKGSSWKSIYAQVCKFLFKDKPDDFLLFLDDHNVFKATTRICFSTEKSTLKSPQQLGDDIWMETNFSASNIVNLLAELFMFFDYPLSDINIEYSNKDNSPKEDYGNEKENAQNSSGNSSFDDLLDQWGKDNL